jgi:hypothetical protein
MLANLFPEHYLKALKIMEDPAFEEQDLLLHDFTERIYREQKGYAKNGFHWGYTEDLVARLTDQGTSGYYAYIFNEKLTSSPGYEWNIKSNSRYSKIKFVEIKKSVIKTVKEALEKAQIREESYLKKKKVARKIDIPLEFEGKEWLLVKYDDNYADEFDVHGFRVFSTEEYKTWKNHIKKGNISYGFGTNEGNEYSSKKEFLSTLTEIPISIEQARTLFDLFGRKSIRCSDWNGRNYDTITHYTECAYSMFPSHVGDPDDLDDDSDGDEEENDNDFE